jgi:hypothetical protein
LDEESRVLRGAALKSICDANLRAPITILAAVRFLASSAKVGGGEDSAFIVSAFDFTLLLLRRFALAPKTICDRPPRPAAPELNGTFFLEDLCWCRVLS